MTGTILWYVHDHGRGHLERARAVIPWLRSPVVVAIGPRLAGEARRVLDVPVVALPSDTDGDGDADPPPPFHHAPTGATLRHRAAALAAAVTAHDVTTAVVDVSIETVVWARLSGLRVVAVRQSGRRTDPGHALAWSSAHCVLVPQHEGLEPVDRAELGTSRWVFTGSFSRFDGATHRGGDTGDPQRRAIVLPGSGGSAFPCRRWRTERTASGWTAVVAGPSFQGAPGVVAAGPIDDLVPPLASSRFALTSAGWGSVADAVSVGCPVVVVAEPRPFDEQRVRASRLAETGLAVVLDEWPGPGDLADVAELVQRRLGGRDQAWQRWRRYYDGGGAQRAAAVVEEVHAS